MSLEKDEIGSSLVADNHDTTETDIIKFVQRSTVFQKHSSDERKKVFNSRKKISEDAYYGILSYNFLFFPRSRPIDQSIFKKRTKEMTEAYIQLYKAGESGNGNTSY